MKFLVIITSLISISAAAETSDLQKQKPVTVIEFNKLIEEGNEQKQDLTKTTSQELPTVKDAAKEVESAQNAQANHDEEGEVTKFIDLEVGEGKTPSVVGVDRRYNSVGEARVVDIDSLSVKLMHKKSGS